MKTNSIAATYPLTSKINAFSYSMWTAMPKFTGEPTTYRQEVERKVLYVHGRTNSYSRKLRKGSCEWDSEALSKAKYLPLGLV